MPDCLAILHRLLLCRPFQEAVAQQALDVTAGRRLEHLPLHVTALPAADDMLACGDASRVEYCVLHGLLLLTEVRIVIYPIGDVRIYSNLLDLLDVLKDKYQGYSYAVSLSTPPEHDNLGEYLVDADIVDPIDPNDLMDKIEDYTSLPNLQEFAMDQLPDSAADILEGATSFF